MSSRVSYVCFLHFFQLQVSDLKKIHFGNSHDDVLRDSNLIQLSLDGISESKSNSISLDVYTLKFDGCRDVYPIKIIRPISKNIVNLYDHFAAVLNDVLQNDLKLQCLVADNPKRAFLKYCMQHAARFACEYCFEPGVLFTSNVDDSDFLKKIDLQRKKILEKINDLDEATDSAEIECLSTIVEQLNETEKISKNKKKHSHIVWPASTSDGEPRTKEKIVRIIEKIEAGEELSQNEKKGIKGRSLLLDIEDFDFVVNVHCEYMHLVPLGVVKRLIELCFSVGESRTRITKRPLTSPSVFNELMKCIKMPREFPRRARKLDLAIMKAQELRNVILFYFPLVTKCLEGSEKEIKLWQWLAFMTRACVIPEEEYQSVSQNSIKYCQRNFFNAYEQLYGPKNCTYSIHIVSCHLLDIRILGPFPETSAFIFESFYAELRKSFQPGTISSVKQMLQNVLLKRMLSKHVCRETIFLKEKDTAYESNCLIYLYKDNSHVIYKIKSIDGNTLVCNQLGNHDVELQTSNVLNWSSVGVYRKGGLSSVDVQIDRDCVAGKVMKVDKYLITCPNIVLREK